MVALHGGLSFFGLICSFPICCMGRGSERTVRSTGGSGTIRTGTLPPFCSGALPPKKEKFRLIFFVGLLMRPSLNHNTNNHNCCFFFGVCRRKSTLPPATTVASCSPTRSSLGWGARGSSLILCFFFHQAVHNTTKLQQAHPSIKPLQKKSTRTTIVKHTPP